MRDPHVVSLKYKLETTGYVSFENAPPVEAEEGSFSVRLENGIVTCKLKEHFSSVDEARKAVEEFLRAWEIQHGLQYGKQEIRFRFDDAKVIDRNPLPPDGNQ